MKFVLDYLFLFFLGRLHVHLSKNIIIFCHFLNNVHNLVGYGIITFSQQLFFSRTRLIFDQTYLSSTQYVRLDPCTNDEYFRVRVLC